MKRYTSIIIVLIALLTSFSLSSCNTNQNNVQDVTEYQKQNDDLMKALETNTEYTASNFGGVSQYKYYYKVLESAPEANKGIRPLQNSKVLVEFSVALASSKQVLSPLDQTELTIMDLTSGRPVGQVLGLQYALMEMQKGDRWEVIIPWQLGYGAFANGTIPAHSALKYEIKLIEITKL